MLIAIVAGYLLLCLGACALQRRLIYFPSVLDSAAAASAAEGEGFVPWRNQAGEIIGWRLPAAGPTTGSVLIVHGNAGSAANRGYLAQPIHEAGAYDVLVLEYPGYGARPGAPALKRFLAAADEAFALLAQSGPVYVVSESLGTGVAAHLAKMHPTDVRGLVLFAPYDNLASVAQNQMPLLPTYWLLTDRFNPAAWLLNYRGPIKVVLAEKDEVIPAKFGQRLFDGYPGPKQLQVMAGARHNDLAGQSVRWWKEVFKFLRQPAEVRKAP